MIVIDDDNDNDDGDVVVNDVGTDDGNDMVRTITGRENSAQSLIFISSIYPSIYHIYPSIYHIYPFIYHIPPSLHLHITSTPSTSPKNILFSTPHFGQGTVAMLEF